MTDGPLSTRRVLYIDYPFQRGSEDARMHSSRRTSALHKGSALPVQANVLRSLDHANICRYFDSIVEARSLQRRPCVAYMPRLYMSCSRILCGH